MKKALKIIGPPLFGIAVLVLFLSHFTPEQYRQIKQAILGARYEFILLSILMGLLSHVLRALRWEQLLRTFTDKKLNKWNLIFAVGISYLMNLGIPRSGEISRAVTVQKYEGLPFNKVLGTIITERIIDLVMLGLFVLLGLYLSHDEIARLLAPLIPRHPYILAGMIPVLAAAAWFGMHMLRRSGNRHLARLYAFLNEIRTGMLSLAKIRRPWLFWLETVAIWSLYLLMLYVVMLAFPGTRHLGWDAVIMAFLAGSISIVISNGGIGTYPVFVTETLMLYGVSKETGFAFSTVMWTAQTLMLIVAGILSFVFLPWTNRRREANPSRY
ncbi:MAG: flippase-like domain-containing protein [Chlorobi bacterium]|nr:flippase-like domain-containing protein [Chlorobiota bacterium]